MPATRPVQQPLPPHARRGGAKLLATVSGLVLLAGVAFLLFGSTSNQLTDPIAQAATRSSSSAGYRIHMAMQMTSSALSAPITADGHGTIDLRDDASSMTLVMNLGSDPQVIQALGSPTMRMEMIMDGAVAYAKLPPALTAQLPTLGKPWIKIDVGKLSGLAGLSSLRSDPAMSDPGQVLQWLTRVSDSVLAEGQQLVNGVETTHYQAQLSLDRLADSLPAAGRGAMQKALSVFEQATQTHTFPVDVWVDADHLVRRVSMTIDLSLPNGPSLQETETVDLSHYGPQPRPAAPPADEVYSAA